MYAVILALMSGFGAFIIWNCFSEIEISADCGSDSGVFGVWSGEALF